MQAVILRLSGFVRSDRGKAGWFLPLSTAVHLAVIGGMLWAGRATITVSSHMPQIELALVAPEPPVPPSMVEPVPMVEPVKVAPAPPTPGPIPKPVHLPNPQPRAVAEPKAVTVFASEATSTAQVEEAAPPTSASAAISEPTNDVLAAYVGQVRAILERVKRYPSEARYDGQEGTVWLRFSLARSGALTDWRLQASSGVPSLDEEAGRMVRRAAPFPSFPTALSRDGLELIVPVRFSLKSS